MRAPSSPATSGRRPLELPNSRRAHSTRDLVWPRIRRFGKLEQKHRPRHRGDARRARPRPAHGCRLILPSRSTRAWRTQRSVAPVITGGIRRHLPGCAGPGPGHSDRLPDRQTPSSPNCGRKEYMNRPVVRRRSQLERGLPGPGLRVPHGVAMSRRAGDRARPLSKIHLRRSRLAFGHKNESSAQIDRNRRESAGIAS